MAKRPRKGSGSDKTLGGGSGDDKQIPDGISASDGVPGPGDEAYIPSTPKPPQPPKNGRTDMNADEAFRRAQQIANHTTPQMGRRERDRIEKMKGPTSEPSAPAPVPGYGGGVHEGEDPRNETITDEELSAMARQSIDAYKNGGEQPDYSWMNESVYERFDAQIGIHDAVDFRLDTIKDIASKFSIEEINSLSVEGHTITRDGINYYGKDGTVIVDTHWNTSLPEDQDRNMRLDVADLHKAIEDHIAANPSQPETRWAVFMENGEKPFQFTRGTVSHNKSMESLYHLKGVMLANDEKFIADRLYLGNLTDEQIAAESKMGPLDRPYHELAFEEVAQRDYSSLSIPATATLTGPDHVVIGDAYEKAKATEAGAKSSAVEEITDRTPEGLQKHADGMFSEGRDLKDIFTATGMKPEGADQTTWEKTEYVYGSETALDRLQGLGKGAFAVGEAHTYVMTDDGKSLLRFDADGNLAGEKSVEDVQAFLHEKLAREFEELQEAKQTAAEIPVEKVEEQALAAPENENEQMGKSAEVAPSELEVSEPQAPTHESEIGPEAGAESNVEEPQKTVDAAQAEMPEPEKDQSLQPEPAVEAKPEAEMTSENVSVSKSDPAQEKQQELASDPEAQTQAEASSLETKEHSPEVAAEQAPANQNEITNDLASEPAQEQKPEQAAEVAQDTQSKVEEGSEMEMAPTKSKEVEADKISDPDHKLDTTTEPQAAQQATKKPDSPEAAEARDYFNKAWAQQDAKEAGATVTADRETTADVSQAPTQGEAQELGKEQNAAPQSADAETAASKSPEAAQTQEASAPQRNDSPEAAEAREYFNKACDQQDAKDAEMAQQPQVSDEEERRRGPGLEAA